jgi:magnesium-transporting ATPase (P-type)
MQNRVKVVLYCGIGLLTLGFIFLIIQFVTSGYRLTPMDMISVGLGFIGYVMAWPSFEDSIKKKPEELDQKNDTDREKPMIQEEIAAKSLQYQVFQTTCIITIAFAAFLYASLQYSPVISILGGCLGGICFAIIARGVILRLGFSFPWS